MRQAQEDRVGAPARGRDGVHRRDGRWPSEGLGSVRVVDLSLCLANLLTSEWREMSSPVWKPVSRCFDAAVLAPSSGGGTATLSSRHRVDGVEVDATIQYEGAVKF